MTTSVCRKSKFSLDDSPSWDGYTFGQTWNGFACPYFEMKVAKEILTFVVAGNNYHDHVNTKYKWNYKPETDKFTFVDPEDDGDHYTIPGEDITYNGKVIHVYGIGNFAWVWTEDEEPIHCEYCNDEIEDGANYLEARPLRAGGATAIFCCSECAGAFFVEQMCDSKALSR